MNQADSRLAMGHDLLPSYVAGTFVREGRPRDMYDHDAIGREEASVVKSARLWMKKPGSPWLNPPFFAWAFAPLSALPYREAAAVFFAINLLLLVASVRLLCKQLPVSDWRVAMVPLFLCTALPFWQAICHQQNTFISLILLLLTVGFWLQEMPFAAGMTVGLLFFKPQLALAVALVLVATAGRRAAAGVLLTGTTLLAVTLVTLPGTLSDYLLKLSPILHVLQFAPTYKWGRQVTFQSFWRLLCEGHVGGATALMPRLLTWIGSATVAAFLVAATRKVIRARNQPSHTGRLRDLIAATIVSMPLLMPYYMDYDLLLLAVPAVLFARRWIQRQTKIAPLCDRCQLGLWIALYFETQFNPGLAGQTRFNLAVPILAALCGITLSRCLKPSDVLTEITSGQSLPPTALAA